MASRRARMLAQQPPSRPPAPTRRLTLADVPPIPDDAEMEVQPNSTKWDAAKERWRTQRPDRASKVHTYIKYRDQVAIDAGDFPWLELYSDGRF